MQTKISESSVQSQKLPIAEMEERAMEFPASTDSEPLVSQKPVSPAPAIQRIVETAPIESAPIETAPIESASVETVPVEKTAALRTFTEELPPQEPLSVSLDPTFNSSATLSNSNATLTTTDAVVEKEIQEKEPVSPISIDLDNVSVKTVSYDNVSPMSYQSMLQRKTPSRRAAPCRRLASAAPAYSSRKKKLQ